MSHNNRRNKDLFQRLTESWGYTKEEEPLDEQMAAGEGEEEEEVQEEGVYQRDAEEEEELEEGGAAARTGNEDHDNGKNRMTPDRVHEAEDEEEEEVVAEQAEEEEEDVVEEEKVDESPELEEAIRKVVQKVLNELVK